MILTGAGFYAAYPPFKAMLFDRMAAFSGQVATATFLITSRTRPVTSAALHRCCG